MNINGETKIIGFFGSTYKTSKMYAMYNAAFDHLKLNYAYIPFVVNNLSRAVESIRHLSIHAVGVTIPFKIAIIPFLDELDENAKRIGAVNVVLNKNGRLIGGNTDGEGAVMALKEKTEVNGNHVILLGAGGTARAIAFAIKDEEGILTIFSRTAQDAKKLAVEVGCDFGELDEFGKIIKNANILIQSTSVGMTPIVDESLVSKKLLHKGLVVQEVVNNPKETKLVREAEEAGCRVVYAERMLLFQSVRKFKMYTGVEAPIDIMEEAIVRS